MLNNNHLNKFGKLTLKDMTYESRIKVYDNNCLQCPYHKIQIKKGITLRDMPSLELAINVAVFDDKASISRTCEADGGFSLAEITSNTCSLWYPQMDTIEDFQELHED